MENVAVVVLDETDPAARERVRQQLGAFNAAQTGMPRGRDLSIVVRDGAGEVVGGLFGWTSLGWLNVDILYLPAALRGGGLGARVLSAAEVEAVRRGCRHARLNTASFQAPDFYRKQGYDVFGVLDDYPGEHKSYFLRKDLRASGA